MSRLSSQCIRRRYGRLLRLLAALFILNVLVSVLCASLVLQPQLSLGHESRLSSHGVFYSQVDRAFAVAAPHHRVRRFGGGWTHGWNVPGASRLMLILGYEDKFGSTEARVISESVWGGFPFVTVSCERCYWLPAMTTPSVRSIHPWDMGVGASDVLESDTTFGYSTTTPTTTPIPFRPEVTGLVLNPLILAAAWLGLNWVRRQIVGRSRRRSGRCAMCGYSLAGIGDLRCPECGTCERVQSE